METPKIVCTLHMFKFSVLSAHCLMHNMSLVRAKIYNCFIYFRLGNICSTQWLFINIHVSFSFIKSFYYLVLSVGWTVIMIYAPYTIHNICIVYLEFDSFIVQIYLKCVEVDIDIHFILFRPFRFLAVNQHSMRR